MNSDDYCIERGKTVEEAISKGIERLDCSKEDVDIEVLEEGGKRKFLGLVTTPATIKVTLKKELTKAKKIVENILNLMDIDGKVFEKKKGSSNILHIYTAGYDGLLIGRGGKTLSALQYIVSKIAKRSGIKLSFSITVGDYNQNAKKKHGSR